MNSIIITNKIEDEDLYSDQFNQLYEEKFLEENPGEESNGPGFPMSGMSEGPTIVKHWFVIDTDTKTMLGYAMIVYQNPEVDMQTLPPGMGFLDGFITKSHRHNQLGSKLLSAITEAARECNIRHLLFNTPLEHGRKFIESHGGVVQSQHAEQRLYLEDIDNTTIQSWNEISLPENFDLELVETIAEEELEEFCQLYTNLSNNLTRENNPKEHQKQKTPQERREEEKIALENNHQWYTLLLRGPNSSIVGITEVYYQPQVPNAIRQNLTGILPDYRGQGLGKLLKGKMIDHIQQSFDDIEYIFTTNDVTNTAMRGINTKLGFQHHKTVYSIRMDL